MMAFPTNHLPSLWNLPSMSGIPAVLGESLGSAVSAANFGSVGEAATPTQISASFKQWGIFDWSYPILTAGRVTELRHEAQYKVSTVPTENGNFVSYNKSKIPGLTTVVMICDGSENGFSLPHSFASSLASGFKNVLGSGAGALQVRKSFFTTLEAMVKDTKLYQVYTPEKTFTNVNVVSYKFKRSEVDGPTMPIVEVQLQEIRNSATLSYRDTKAKTPAASSPVEAGQVQIQALPSGAPDLSGITRGVMKSWLVSSL